MMTSFSLGPSIRPQRASRSLQCSGPRTTPKFAATGVEKSFPRVYAVAKESSASSSQSVEAAASVLREAATDPSIPPPKVFRAMRDLEEAKLPTEGWPEILGGTSSPGRRWRLVFTSGTKEVQKALRGVGQGSGKYFPITAAQRWDATANTIENGVYFGHIAALSFSGPYCMKGKKLTFDFDTIHLKLGPSKFNIPLKKKIVDYVPSRKDPFFLFFYVDEDVVAARGRSGGVAYWARTTPAWELEKGIS